MSRRDVLTAIELAAVTTALAAALPILAHAADYHAGWGAPALLGTLALAAILGAVTPAALVVIALDWGRRRREQSDVPPSARTPLWPATEAPEIQAWDDAHPQPHQAAYDAVRQARYGADAAGRHSAPRDTPTERYTAEELAEYAGVGR